MAEATSGEMKRSLTLTGDHGERHGAHRAGRVPLDDVPGRSPPSPSGGKSTATDMWTGLLFSLILALLTAYSYAELARIYPDAGTGSSYYFAEAALLDKEKPEHQRMRPLRQAVGRLDQPPLLLDLPGHHGGLHRAPCSATSTLTLVHHQLTYLPLAIVAVVFAVRRPATSPTAASAARR